MISVLASFSGNMSALHITYGLTGIFARSLLREVCGSGLHSIHIDQALACESLSCAYATLMVFHISLILLVATIIYPRLLRAYVHS